jgi:hypothetical protein
MRAKEAPSNQYLKITPALAQTSFPWPISFNTVMATL